MLAMKKIFTPTLVCTAAGLFSILFFTACNSDKTAGWGFGDLFCQSLVFLIIR